MGVVVERLAQSHARRVFRKFAQMNVVPAGGVLKQVNDTNRIAGFPAILEPDLGSQLVSPLADFLRCRSCGSSGGYCSRMRGVID